MTLLVLLVVMVLLALLVNIVPGDPAKTILGSRATPAVIARVRESMDLDKPVPVQVINFIKNILHGSFGTDVFSGQSINTHIETNLPHTLILAWVSPGAGRAHRHPARRLFGHPPELLARPRHRDHFHLVHYAALVRHRAFPAADLCRVAESACRRWAWASRATLGTTSST